MSDKINLYKKVTLFLSIIVPLLVVILYYFLPEKSELSYDLSFIPKINASLNFCVAILLVLALFFIKKKEIKKHQISMSLALLLSILFLLCYVVYHYFYESTSYGGEGFLKYIYLFILISHILLAIVVIPFVLMSFSYALAQQIEKHKKLSKYTWLIWFYVSVTGVLVYLLISPYY